MIWTVTANPCFDEFQGKEQTVRRAGGKGVNVSRALLALGLPSETVVLLGGDRDRKNEFVSLLRQEGLRPRVIRGQALRVCREVLLPSGGTEERNERGNPPPAGTQRRLTQFLSRHVKRGDTVFLCGSLPPGLHAGAYRSLTEICRRAGAYTVTDCAGANLRQAVRAKPDLIKPNLAEFTALTGLRIPQEQPGETAEEAIMRRADAVMDEASAYADLTGVRVLCTLGEDGAVYADRDGAVMTPAFPVNAKIVKGAGDTFLGTFLWASRLAENPLPLLPALRAAASAASALLEAGALPLADDLLRRFREEETENGGDEMNSESDRAVNGGDERETV